MGVGVPSSTCKLHPLAVKATSTQRTMSTYFKDLDKPTQERYILKLELAGLTIQDDPYSPSRRSSDVSHWPRIEHGDIFGYFIRTYTLQQLASWRQLEAYNYFKNNYVQIILSLHGGRSCC